MKVREVKTANPLCCLATDTAQKVAQTLRKKHIGSLPVIRDQSSLQLIGMITDRDLCCSVIADGLDPKSTTIENFISTDLVTCRDDDGLDQCERAMQEHQLRRIPVVDDQGRCIGIVSQADLALKGPPDKVSRTVAEISKPGPERPAVAA